MALSTEQQQEITQIYQSVSQYFATTGYPQDYYSASSQNLSGLQEELDAIQNETVEETTTLTETFIADLEQQVKYKTSEIEMLKNQLLLLDLKIDSYDTIIQNIDKEIIVFLDEINVGINSVKTAYETRVSAGCSSDLHWLPISTQTYTVEGTSYTILDYICTKNSNVREDYNYYGVKYYRKPLNQDYDSNIIEEFSGTISLGSSSLAIVGSASTFKYQIGDTIVDNIDNPVVFSSANLPTIVSFGTTSLVGTSTDFGGTISFGSTIIAHVGVGTTVGINTGDSISLSGVIAPNTTVVGFGTTTISLTNVWKPNWGGPGVGSFISTTGVTNSLIISIASIGSTTNGNFKVGLLTSYSSINLSNISIFSAENSNFTVIRNTQTSYTEFDSTNNPIDPVTIGIMNNNSVGFGHSLKLVNNGSPIGPFQWNEVLGEEYAPEPNCGASYARYYPGNNSWPTKTEYSYNSAGIVIGFVTTYAQEGDVVTVGLGSTPSKFGIGYTGTSQLNPSAGTCNPLNTAIANAIASRDNIISINSPKINGLINSSSALRRLRDKFESHAFSILQGRVSADVELNILKQDLAALQTTDLSAFEPTSYYFNPDTGKTSTTTVGVGTV